MSTESYNLWVQEVKKSLKQDELPLFQKVISGEESIEAISVGRNDSFFQRKALTQRPFLAIQNYSELVSGELEAWIRHEQVGLRFRQLEDIPQNDLLKQKTLFLSQPFLFSPDIRQQETLTFLESMGATLNLGWSPLSFGLTRGEILKKPLSGLEKIVQDKILQSKTTCWFYLSSAPYQWAGAQPHAELAILLSMTYEILQELEYCKMPLVKALEKISYGLSLGTDVLLEPAKIIALKHLSLRLVELIEKDTVFDVPSVYAMPSLRVYSARQPWNNLIRNTLMCSSAIVGGAQGFKCIPYDVLNRHKQKNALRESTNVPLLLSHEARMQDVLNPLDGAPLFAQAIEVLCKTAWDFFKEIEKKGGIFEAVRSGWLQMELMRQSEVSQKKVNSLESPLIGVNQFVDQRFKYSDVSSPKSQLIPLEEIIDPLFLQKTDDEYMSVQPLIISSLTEGWEALQEAVGRAVQKKIIVVKTPAPNTEKKNKMLKKVFDVLGCHALVLEDAQISSEMSLANLAILVVPDAQEGHLLLSKVKELSHCKVLTFLTTGTTDTGDFILETQSPLEMAEKIVKLLAVHDE